MHEVVSTQIDILQVRVSIFEKVNDIRTLKEVVIQFDSQEEAKRWKTALLIKTNGGT
jgi:hypothetical protein